MKNLIIVESPSKSKTIEKYLGKDFVVDASGGHIRDLPDKYLGIDIKNNFEPKYVLNPDKKEVAKRLAQKVAKADKIYLATDPDREGEAISWHLAKLLDLEGKNYCRIEFNEISKTAVNKAIENPRQINMDLVDAQQARRVLDRLVGYKLSPYLCKVLQEKLSAGRVQSSALKMVVDREKEIRAFVPKEYWNIAANLFLPTEKDLVFRASLVEFLGNKEKPENKEQAQKVQQNLENAKYIVDKITKSSTKGHPFAPFTTSTMQQDASAKLNMTSTTTMSIAQNLYEGVEIDGNFVALTTYIRTDSVRVSNEAIASAREFILKKFGEKYLPEKPRFYKTKKTAQDAHEAIRPISLDVTPESIKGKVQANHYKLYKLIYDRFLASQIADAIYDNVNVDILANDCKFKAVGKVQTFKGYTVVYSNEVENDEDNVISKLPKLQKNDVLSLEKLLCEQKFTKPPVRYTDASLIKAMEEEGIGRPSTYASIIGVLQKRTYTTKEGKSLVPTEIAFSALEILEKHFAKIVDLKFTAKMESSLDDIADGKTEWKKLIEGFYPYLEKKLVEAGADLIEETDELCAKCGSPIIIRTGRYGKFKCCSNYPTCKNIINNDELTEEVCEKCGSKMFLRNGKFGKYYACSNYPTCKNNRPIDEKITDQKCEVCGGNLVLKSGKFGEYLRCKTCKTNKPATKPVGKCPQCGKDIYEKRGRYGKSFYACSGYPECKFIVNKIEDLNKTDGDK